MRHHSFTDFADDTLQLKCGTAVLSVFAQRIYGALGSDCFSADSVGHTHNGPTLRFGFCVSPKACCEKRENRKVEHFFQKNGKYSYLEKFNLTILTLFATGFKQEAKFES